METGLDCQGHKSIPACWLVHWISIFYEYTFLWRTSPKHLVGTVQMDAFHCTEEAPLPPLKDISHQSLLLKNQTPVSTDKDHFINKLDSCLQFYSNFYNIPDVSLKLICRWLQSSWQQGTFVSARAKPIVGRYCASFLTLLPTNLILDLQILCYSLPMPNYAVVLRCTQINSQALSSMLN